MAGPATGVRIPNLEAKRESRKLVAAGSCTGIAQALKCGTTRMAADMTVRWFGIKPLVGGWTISGMWRGCRRRGVRKKGNGGTGAGEVFRLLKFSSTDATSFVRDVRAFPSSSDSRHLVGGGGLPGKEDPDGR